VQCSRGHELQAAVKFCPECGEPQQFCPSGHKLSGEERYCPECGIPLESKGEKSPAESVDVARASTTSEPPDGTDGLQSNLDDVIVKCGACGFEESASGDENGWQCGKCDANWYIMTCGWCGEAQPLPEDLLHMRCSSCSKILARKAEYSEESTIEDVRPMGRDLLRVNSRSGVIREFAAPEDAPTPIAPELAPTIRSPDGTMTVKGHNGHVIFDGASVAILRTGFMARATVGKGEKVIPISSISAIDWKPAGPFTNGFIAFTVAGALESRKQFGARTKGAVRDQNSVVFMTSQQSDFETLRQAIQTAINIRGR
jgi:hypothetical protein